MHRFTTEISHRGRSNMSYQGKAEHLNTPKATKPAIPRLRCCLFQRPLQAHAACMQSTGQPIKTVQAKMPHFRSIIASP